MLLNQSNLLTLFKGFKANFNGALTETPALWSQLATEVPSNTSSEEYAWLGNFPEIREWLGDRQVQNVVTHGFTIKNKTFEGTVGVPRESIEDDQYGVYAPLFQELGRSAAKHPDNLLIKLIKDNGTCYDGKAFFATDHKVGDKTFANRPNTLGSGEWWMLIDDTRSLKPFILQRRRAYQLLAKTDLRDDNVFMHNEYVYGVDGRLNVGYGLWQFAYGSRATLDATSYAAARQAMLSLKKSNGDSLSVNPSLLVVGPGNEGAAREILLNERNDSGATNKWRNSAKLLVLPELAN